MLRKIVGVFVVSSVVFNVVVVIMIVIVVEIVVTIMVKVVVMVITVMVTLTDSGTLKTCICMLIESTLTLLIVKLKFLVGVSHW